jgi:hypothetical protein
MGHGGGRKAGVTSSPRPKFHRDKFGEMNVKCLDLTPFLPISHSAPVAACG